MKSLFLFLFLITIFISSSFASSKMTGKVRIDGSSTVYPITEAIAEKFRESFPKVRVNIGVSGTGGGFKKFVRNDIDINDASRKIKDQEKILANKAAISYLELPVAFDGITVVINPHNTWAKNLATEELKKIWEAGSKIFLWSDLRSEWPKRKIKLYGPGTDSGTFDYFTKAINGKSGNCRSDFTKSEDDNILVKGVAGDRDALGFFGFAYFKENKAILNAVEIDGVMPTKKTINNGSYKPLSRPIFIYVNRGSLRNKAVNKFVSFYMKEAKGLVEDVGYVPLTSKQYDNNLLSLKQ